MRIILSRKGVDSGNSNASNLVLLDSYFNGEMVMLPIPNLADKFTYKDVQFSKGNDCFVKNYLQERKIDLNTKCHLDPMLINYFDNPSFLGAIGQVGASQTHLEKQKIKKGDLFIFFGKFESKMILKNKVDTISKKDHIMFGYLQIGEIIYPNSRDKEKRPFFEKKYPWIKNHPHWNFEKYKNSTNNCIYIANEKCSFDKNIKGYGVFDFSKDLILTKSGKSISKWNIIEPLKNLEISYHTLASFKQDYFQSAAHGQEFVIEESSSAENWAIDLIKNNVKKK